MNISTCSNDIDSILVSYRGTQYCVLLFLYNVLKFTNSVKEECVSVEERPEVKSPPAERDPFHWRPLLSLSCSTPSPLVPAVLFCLAIVHAFCKKSRGFNPLCWCRVSGCWNNAGNGFHNPWG